MKSTNIQLLALLVLALLPSLGSAQNYEWTKTNAIYISTPSVSTQDAPGVSIETDDSNNVVVVGNFQGTVDFDPSAGVSNLATATSTQEPFIQKLDTDGNLLWVKKLTANGFFNAKAHSMTLDAANNIYITGNINCNSFNPIDMDPGAGVFELTVPGAFILKLDPNGDFIWAKSVGQDNSLAAFGTDIVVDDANNVYVTGLHDGGDFDPGPNVLDISDAFSGVFILKLDSNGDLAWAKAFNNINTTQYNGTIRAAGIDVDNSGNVFTVGSFTGEVDFDPNGGVNSVVSSILPDAPLNDDMYISKLDATGNFVWVKTMGNVSINRMFAIELDNSSNIYTTGFFVGTLDIDPSSNIHNLEATNSERGAFIQKLDSEGNFLWANTFNASINYGGKTEGKALTLDTDGGVYTTGEFEGAIDFNSDSVEEYMNPITNWNLYTKMVYIQKLDAEGNFQWTKFIKSTDGIAYSRDIQVDSEHNVLTAGSFYNTVDFNPLDGGEVFTSVSTNFRDDIYIQKLDSTMTSVGIIENNFNTDLIVYPNPTKGDLSFDLGSNYPSVSVRIMDASGRLVMLKSYTNQQFLNLTLNEPAGVYILHIVTDDKKAAIRLVKE